MQTKFDELFLLLQPGASPTGDRLTKERDVVRTHFLFVPDAAVAARVASELAEDGVRLVEMYRGFDLTSTARVIEAVAGRAPVGWASYGPESSAGPPVHAASSWACLYDDPAADPSVDRITHQDGDQRTTIVGVPSDKVAVEVAAELAGDGVQVVELCGASPLTRAARLREALGPQIGVGHVRWPFESLDGVNAYKAAYEAAFQAQE